MLQLALLCLLLAVARGATVSVVNTAQQLKAAMDSGRKHIHIEEHLDLTGLDAASANICGGSCASRDPSKGSQGSASSGTQLYPGLFLGPEIESLTVRSHIDVHDAPQALSQARALARKARCSAPPHLFCSAKCGGCAASRSRARSPA